MKIEILGIAAVRLMPENDADQAVLKNMDGKYLNITTKSKPATKPSHLGGHTVETTYEVTQADCTLLHSEEIQKLNSLTEKEND